jgi:hypothetical protein
MRTGSRLGPTHVGQFHEHRRVRQAGARALEEILRLERSTRRSESRAIEGELARLKAGHLCMAPGRVQAAVGDVPGKGDKGTASLDRGLSDPHSPCV